MLLLLPAASQPSLLYARRGWPALAWCTAALKSCSGSSSCCAFAAAKRETSAPGNASLSSSSLAATSSTRHARRATSAGAGCSRPGDITSGSTASSDCTRACSSSDGMPASRATTCGTEQQQQWRVPVGGALHARSMRSRCLPLRALTLIASAHLEFGVQAAGSAMAAGL